MKSGHRAKAYRLWRSGHEGLVTIQKLVDKAIEEAAESEPKETCFSGLPDLKLRINRELRDNAAFELRHRRESLEMEDIELAHKTDLAYLKRLRERVEAQLTDLLALDDLQSVLGRGPKGPAEPKADLQSDADKPVIVNDKVQSDTIGDDAGPTGASEDGHVGPPPSQEADTSEAHADDPAPPPMTPGG